MREHLVLEGVLMVEDGGQLLVVDVDQLGGVACLGRAPGNDTATASPAKVTRSMANGRWVGAFWSGEIGQALIITPWVSARSLPVNTS